MCGKPLSPPNIKHGHPFSVWQRDFDEITVTDIRLVKSGDKSPCGNGVLSIVRGIEVGHIFKLGDCYSKAMQARVLADNGLQSDLVMGCYGIGISRIVAAAIEQSHDSRGIVWPKSIAPFDVHLIMLGAKKNPKVLDVAEKFYELLENIGYDVLFDDRDNGAGSLLADADLLGVPWRLIISAKSIDNGGAELKLRSSEKSQYVDLDNIIYSINNIED